MKPHMGEKNSTGNCAGSFPFKGIQKATSIPWTRIVHSQEVLTSEFESFVFFHLQETIFEGEYSSCKEQYYGTGMFRFDLPVNKKSIDFQKLECLIKNSCRFKMRFWRMTFSQIEQRLLGVEMGTIRFETDVKFVGESLLVDVGFEVPIEENAENFLARN